MTRLNNYHAINFKTPLAKSAEQDVKAKSANNDVNLFEKISSSDYDVKNYTSQKNIGNKLNISDNNLFKTQIEDVANKNISKNTLEDSKISGNVKNSVPSAPATPAAAAAPTAPVAPTAPSAQTVQVNKNISKNSTLSDGKISGNIKQNTFTTIAANNDGTTTATTNIEGENKPIDTITRTYDKKGRLTEKLEIGSNSEITSTYTYNNDDTITEHRYGIIEKETMTGATRYIDETITFRPDGTVLESKVTFNSTDGIESEEENIIEIISVEDLNLSDFKEYTEIENRRNNIPVNNDNNVNADNMAANDNVNAGDAPNNISRDEQGRVTFIKSAGFPHLYDTAITYNDDGTTTLTERNPNDRNAPTTITTYDADGNKISTQTTTPTVKTLEDGSVQVGYELCTREYEYNEDGTVTVYTSSYDSDNRQIRSGNYTYDAATKRILGGENVEYNTDGSVKSVDTMPTDGSMAVKSSLNSSDKLEDMINNLLHLQSTNKNNGSKPSLLNNNFIYMAETAKVESLLDMKKPINARLKKTI